MIQAHHLVKHFGALCAVDDVSFSLQPGETFGLLGPNGAGKTTTIHLLVGALAPDSGKVEIDGNTDPTRAEVRQRIGVAPQALALYEELTGEENVAFFGTLYGLSGKSLREAVHKALEFCGLLDRRKDRMSQYSGGMKRRLNLACAIVHEPQVIFLDEPTVGVDPQSRNYIFDNIEKLKQSGRTILYTTHYMEEAERLCERVAIMDHGKILALDTVEGLIHEHGGLAVVEARFDQKPMDLSAWKQAGEVWRMETSKPLEQIAILATTGAKLATLRIERPDLEVVFLALTGRSLRD